MITWFLLTTASASLRWDVELTVFAEHTEAPRVHGEPLRQANFTLDCDEVVDSGDWRCHLAGHQARIGMPADGDAMVITEVSVDPALWFEVRWRPDGRLKRFRPEGPNPEGLIDWVSLGVAALAVPSPPSEGATTWVHRDPAVMSLAGRARAMAAQLSIQVEGPGRLRVSGSGGLDGATVARISKGATKGTVTLDAEGTVALDTDGRVRARRLTTWLLPSDGYATGNVGSQRVVVRRVEP